ncbi:MAG: PQQ-binding-like beta-propeller repeat protein, partial [Candidatus Thermoplasmatota archaeon]|nr:PQQ-binding-like beta-propeller repeat protein [Candidatus Thermoplasmatota archaeon]
MVIIKSEKYMILPHGFWQKKSVFFIILLLLFSTFSSFVVSEDPVPLLFVEGQDDEDGVYYTSTFLDVDEYFGGCVRSSQGNKLMLDPDGSRFKNYNFSDWDSESPHAMYAGDLFWFSQVYPLSWVMNLFEEKVEEDPYYRAASKLDGITYPYEYKVNPSAFQQIHHFRFKITQDITTSSSFNVTWIGKASNYKSVSLYMWKTIYGPVGSWQKIDSITDNRTSLQLTYDNESLSLGTDDYLDICVIVVPSLGDDCTIQTDYVNVKVQGKGYATEGAARFNPVIPDSDKISRWERFTWSGYEKPLTSISFQFFHEENNSFSLIRDAFIDDNSKGISDNVIDLSLLPTDVNLTVNVSMSTRDLSVSPELYEWGVSWQVDDEYWMDRLSTDLRVDANKIKNIRINDGKASLVTTVYDWPMNGQNAQNTRASPGLGPGSYSSLCWEGKEKVGGNQKNPIVNDGVLYIANSISRKIYAYDAQYDISYLPNGFNDRSNNFDHNIMNSPVATTKNTIVVATGSSESGGGVANKVVALNANDLRSQQWMFSFGSVNTDDSSICYEASPVLSEDKIYLTSWNGDSSLLDNVFDFFNLSKGNNKLICLTDEGSYEWSQDLAAGSFASPAVSEELDLVVAGCEKLNGDSLYAFNLDGTSMWTADVGPIGSASPVIYEDTVYVVSKKTGQNPVTAYTQVVAVDSSSGTIKWNTTIGDIVPELYTNAAVSSPSVADGFLYVASPDGILYKIDADDGSVMKTNTIWTKGVSSTILRSSPAYADGMIYIGSPNGYLYAINADTLEKSWDKKTDSLSPIFSSPVIVDGFVYYVDESHSLYCRGRQQISVNEQITGEMVSMPITRPDGWYWERFDVVDDTNTGNIDYSILNEDYNVLMDDVEDNSLLNSDSVIAEDTIRLKADFHANAKEEVTLDSWKVSFTGEDPSDGETVFQNFEKNLSYPPVFSIEVEDEEDGLINTSARFKLEYSNETSGTFVTNWLPANCSGENESTDEEIITVNMSYIDIIDEIDLYHRIRFSINDTKGYTAYSDWYFIEGKPDEQPPVFNMDSFTPDPPYISTMTPTCTIQAVDVGSNGNTTGINVYSAEYRFRYTDDGTTKTQTENAICTGNNGTT